jgi:hypothetical protein
MKFNFELRDFWDTLCCVIMYCILTIRRPGMLVQNIDLYFGKARFEFRSV